jgi:hypothetical protein
MPRQSTLFSTTQNKATSLRFENDLLYLHLVEKIITLHGIR